MERLKVEVDIQNQKDSRRIRIDKVGVKEVIYPIVVRDKVHGEQHTVASINLYVNLPHHFRGAHMSRFIEILNEHRGQITMDNIGAMLLDMKKRLNAESAHLEAEFPYFLEKEAPATRAQGMMGYTCRFIASHDAKEDFILGVVVPVTTLCPCSREMCEQGAHSQRAYVTVYVRFEGFVWIEDLIELVESCASSEVYSLLKRRDEKFVSEKAYRRPRFVEDVVREVAEKLNVHPQITWFSVEAESLESIHNHNAYAYVERDKRENFAG